MVVFADADLDDAVDWALAGVFICSGQVCSATSRVVVDSSVAAVFSAKLVAAARAKLVVGDPLAKSTNMGPLVSEGQRDSVAEFVAAAWADPRCEPLLPESLASWEGDRSRAGYYASPQIFRVKPLNLRWPEVWREEIFGPVLCVAEFDAGDTSQAISIANDSPYGLAHAFFTNDPSIASEASRRLRAGVVWQNCSQPVYPSTPFGGCKSSGFGREYGALGLEEFLHAKTVITADRGHKWSWFG
jgi:betaine-aldehyde dehydrogenase